CGRAWPPWDVPVGARGPPRPVRPRAAPGGGWGVARAPPERASAYRRARRGGRALPALDGVSLHSTRLISHHIVPHPKSPALRNVDEHLAGGEGGQGYRPVSDPCRTRRSAGRRLTKPGP